MQRREGKIGWNDSCWCGSGKKFKRCHYLIKKPDKSLAADVAKLYRLSSFQRVCLAPERYIGECSDTVISAHTVPKSHLVRIASEGHVRQIRVEFSPGSAQLPFKERLIGVNQASTITGFCGFHDDVLFAPLEKQPFSATSEQCFLLMYRAIARELFLKQAVVKSTEKRKKIFGARRIRMRPEAAGLADSHELGSRKGLRDIASYKTEVDALLLRRAFEATRSYVLEFEGIQDIMGGGALFPECDFGGSFLPNRARLGVMEGERPDLMSFSGIAGERNGFVVFSWLPSSDRTCMPFIESLEGVSDDSLGDALLRFFCEFCENTYFRPAWWDRLTEMQRAALVVRLATGGSPFHERHPACLVDDGLRLARWKVKARNLLVS